MSEQPRKENRGQLFVISAPSGAGKTSLVRALMERSNTIGVAISHTTRARRPEETDGINYHFVPEVEFNALVDRGEFLESATVFEYLYGTSTTAVNLILHQGKHLILEIDWQGAAQVRQKLPGTQSIFFSLLLSAPSGIDSRTAPRMTWKLLINGCLRPLKSCHTGMSSTT